MSKGTVKTVRFSHVFFREYGRDISLDAVLPDVPTVHFPLGLSDTVVIRDINGAITGGFNIWSNDCVGLFCGNDLIVDGSSKASDSKLSPTSESSNVPNTPDNTLSVINIKGSEVNLNTVNPQNSFKADFLTSNLTSVDSVSTSIVVNMGCGSTGVVSAPSIIDISPQLTHSSELSFGSRHGEFRRKLLRGEYYGGTVEEYQLVDEVVSKKKKSSAADGNWSHLSQHKRKLKFSNGVLAVPFSTIQARDLEYCVSITKLFAERRKNIEGCLCDLLSPEMLQRETLPKLREACLERGLPTDGKNKRDFVYNLLLHSFRNLGCARARVLPTLLREALVEAGVSAERSAEIAEGFLRFGVTSRKYLCYMPFLAEKQCCSPRSSPKMLGTGSRRNSVSAVAPNIVDNGSVLGKHCRNADSADFQSLSSKKQSIIIENLHSVSGCSLSAYSEAPPSPPLPSSHPFSAPIFALEDSRDQYLRSFRKKSLEQLEIDLADDPIFLDDEFPKVPVDRLARAHYEATELARYLRNCPPSPGVDRAHHVTIREVVDSVNAVSQKLGTSPSQASMEEARVISARLLSCIPDNSKNNVEKGRMSPLEISSPGTSSSGASSSPSDQVIHPEPDANSVLGVVSDYMAILRESVCPCSVNGLGCFSGVCKCNPNLCSNRPTGDPSARVFDDEAIKSHRDLILSLMNRLRETPDKTDPNYKDDGGYHLFFDEETVLREGNRRHEQGKMIKEEVMAQMSFLASVDSDADDDTLNLLYSDHSLLVEDAIIQGIAAVEHKNNSSPLSSTVGSSDVNSPASSQFTSLPNDCVGSHPTSDSLNTGASATSSHVVNHINLNTIGARPTETRVSSLGGIYDNNNNKTGIEYVAPLDSVSMWSHPISTLSADIGAKCDVTDLSVGVGFALTPSGFSSTSVSESPSKVSSPPADDLLYHIDVTDTPSPTTLSVAV